MTQIPGRFKIDKNQAELSEVKEHVSEALNQLPPEIDFTITSSRRNVGNTGNKSKSHISGTAIDLSDNDQGLKFWNWLDTDSGSEWQNSNNVEVLYHKNHSNTGYHYHVQFNKK